MINAVEMIIFLFSIIGTFLWCRTEAREDNRAVEARVEALITAIHAEIKDFHGRLCALEDRINRS